MRRETRRERNGSEHSSNREEASSTRVELREEEIKNIMIGETVLITN